MQKFSLIFLDETINLLIVSLITFKTQFRKLKTHTHTHTHAHTQIIKKMKQKIEKPNPSLKQLQ